jgi:hypothetical protein
MGSKRKNGFHSSPAGLFTVLLSTSPRLVRVAAYPLKAQPRKTIEASKPISTTGLLFSELPTGLTVLQAHLFSSKWVF